MKKVQTKNKLKGFFGLFAAFALSIGVGVSLAPKGSVKTDAASTTTTVTLPNNASDSGTAFTTATITTVANGLKDATNGDFIKSTTSTNNVYPGTNGFKYISGSTAGKWKFKTTEVVTKVELVFNKYGSDASSTAKLTSHGDSKTATSANIVNGTTLVLDNISGDEFSIDGVKASKGRFYLKSMTFTYEAGGPAKTLSSIAVTAQPDKKVYDVGESFDKTGLEVTATFSDTTTLDVTDSVTIAPDPLTAGTTSLTVSYEYGSDTKTTTITGITVNVPTYSTVTYSISSKNTFTKTGTAPTGSTAALVESYTASKQMTKDNTQKVTLSNYNNIKISGITISMHSNNSAGAGKFEYSTDNEVTWTTIIADSKFNTAGWYGGWSNPAFVPVVKTVNIEVKSSIIFKITSSENSLFAESYQFRWEEIPQILVSSVAVSPKTGTIYSGGTANKTLQLGAVVLPTNASDKELKWETSSESTATVSSSGLVTAVAPGTVTITAIALDASGESDTATITVAAKAVSGLSKNGTLVRDEYNIGDAFDPTGLTFTATYNNGETAVIPHNQLSFNPSTFSFGDTSVSVSFSGKSVIVENIIVNNIQFVGLVKSGTLIKTSYFVGETFDPSGLSFAALYSDESEVDLTYADVTFTPSVMAVGTTSVVASYLGETTTISGISVQQIVLENISIKTPASKLTFKFGEDFSYAGLVINANYNNETIVKSSGFEVSTIDTMVLGTHKVTVSFGGKQVDYNVKVTNQGASIGDVLGTEYVSPTASGGAISTWTSVGAGSAYADGSVKLDASGDSVHKTDIWSAAQSQNMKSISFTIKLKNNGGENNTQNKVTIKAINGDASTVVGSVEQLSNFTKDTAKDYTFNITSLSGPVTGLVVEYTTKVTGNLGVYYIKATPTYSGISNLEQATAFANYVVDGVGLNAEGQCQTAYDALLEEYNFMPEASKTEFKTSSDAVIMEARARINYLEAFLGIQSGISGSGASPKSSGAITDNSLTATIIIGVIGLTTLAGYYFLQKKKEA